MGRSRRWRKAAARRPPAAPISARREPRRSPAPRSPGSHRARVRTRRPSPSGPRRRTCCARSRAGHRPAARTAPAPARRHRPPAPPRRRSRAARRAVCRAGVLGPSSADVRGGWTRCQAGGFPGSTDMTLTLMRLVAALGPLTGIALVLFGMDNFGPAWRLPLCLWASTPVPLGYWVGRRITRSESPRRIVLVGLAIAAVLAIWLYWDAFLGLRAAARRALPSWSPFLLRCIRPSSSALLS